MGEAFRQINYCWKYCKGEAFR